MQYNIQRVTAILPTLYLFLTSGYFCVTILEEYEFLHTAQPETLAAQSLLLLEFIPSTHYYYNGAWS
ncbi:hypothetical protein K7432_004177 [Basidiobolus ranarum]|uniref:Uncharacterized protein n=1 Tax=Basidiobolus ranarum TaxID=34480 RepID=A0ABR2WYM0_9FUNG